MLTNVIFLPLKVLKEYWTNAQNGGRKSIPYTAFEEKYRVYNKKRISCTLFGGYKYFSFGGIVYENAFSNFNNYIDF